MPQSPRWTRRPEGSTWGDWGPDDQLGRLNLLTPEKVLQGIAEVKAGRTFCLSLPLDYPGGSTINPRRTPPELMPTIREGRPNMAVPLRCYDPTALDVICDDRVLLTLQYSTQWDSLAHVGQMFDADGDGEPEDVFYNGFRAGTDIAGPYTYAGTRQQPNPVPPGAHRLGVENMAAACIQGRAVMIDLEAHFGRTGQIVGYDELMMVLARDQVVVEPGDMVCLRTGFAEMLLGMNRQPDATKLFASTSALDGRDPRLLQWITDSGLVSLIADNYAVEAHPARPGTGDPCATLPLHAHCLFKLGVNLGEMWQLHELADWLRKHGRSRFLLTAPPLRLPGAVGSPANAIGTV
jgi:hypothetical protein